LKGFRSRQGNPLKSEGVVAMISVRGLVKRIEGDVVLDGVSLEVEKGEFVAVIGPSGSGKTTLLRCMSLRDSWDEGSIFYEGADLKKAGWLKTFRLRRQWAYLDEDPELRLHRSAYQNVVLGKRDKFPLWRWLTGTVPWDDRMAAMDCLEKLGLLDKANAKVETLSGGERQRVAIARALVRGARVLFLDEPVSNLNPQIAETVLRTLRSLCREQGMTVIASIHQLEWAERFPTRIVGLNGGRVALDIPARRLTAEERDRVF